MALEWRNDTLQPLGEKDASIQITCLPGEEVGLFTFRGGKDRDLSAEEFEAIGLACLKARDRLWGMEDDD